MRGPSALELLLAAVLALAALTGRDASAEPKRSAPAPQESARSYYERATSAFGLAAYDRAAELYEKAFELRADPALLYNAAQSHRLAGHKERALELYRNYLRLFPDSGQAPDARRHMSELQGGAPMSPVSPVGSDLAPPRRWGTNRRHGSRAARGRPPRRSPTWR
jgi:tetratricopeptide (TPR) repeat protein